MFNKSTAVAGEVGTSRQGEEEEGNYHQAVGEVNSHPVEVEEETHYP
jgi:hypothetical protein